MPFPEHNETFVVNDIVLAIPPESISIQKEDLVYQWKTLRNKVSTKVASGNGQNIVNTEIAYKYDDILELQRLILSLRETPFCYIENMYLRETFVPNWALSQKMAFTCTDLVMSPYDGASDVFRVSLKLVWFNYFPYLHNWLYRKEWATKWIKTDKSKVKYSIGWDIDEKGIKTGHRFNVVEELLLGSGDVRESEMEDMYGESEQNLNILLDPSRAGLGLGGEAGRLAEAMAGAYPIYEMVDAFNSAESEQDLSVNSKKPIDFTYTSLYDLMPLPDMMEQSLPVGSPQESFIYKRFLNFRQRDALKKDFGIDVEGDLIDCPNILKLLFSTYWNAQGEPFVLSLHLPAPYDIGLPTYEVDVYNSLRADWIQKILSFNSNITFSFNVYQTVLLPSLIKPRVEGILNGESYSGAGTSGKWIYNDERTKKYGVRTFMHNEAGFHYPLGNNMAEPYAFGHSIGSRHEPRSDATYGGNTEKYRFHTGFDLGKEGDTFFAVKPGVVSRIQDRQAKEDLKWKMTSLEDGKLVERDIYKPADYIDLFEAVRKYLFDKMKTNMLPGLEIVKGKKDGGITQFTAAFKKTKEFGYFQIGLFLQSPTHRDRVYFLDSKSFDGRLLTIKHHDETIANYYHWKSLRSGLAVGDRVDAGEFLGNVGDASTIDSTKGFHELRKAGTGWIINNVSDVPHHLHFEYWEPRNLHPERNPVEDDSNRNIPTYFLSSMEDYINVDWSYLQQKWPNDFQVPDGTQDGGFVKEELKREIEVVKDEVKEEANSEVLAALEKIVLLIDNDWTYYNKASDVRNVWQKQLSFTIEKSNTLDVLQQDYLILEGLVFSNFVAGFNNIVSSIPILDHEFPTHQFLGATEPFYNLEFYGIDNRIWADASFLFEGLGDNAVNLERVRQLLLENSIGYRKIPNSWTCSVDTFITRLFGTYSYPDMLVDEYVEDGEVGIDVAEMKKRAAITRVSSETLAESPGTSRIMMDILETNNFDQETIVNQGLTSKDMDDRIEKVLKKLYEFNVSVDSNLEAALAIAKLLDVNLDILNDNSLEILQEGGNINRYNAALAVIPAMYGAPIGFDGDFTAYVTRLAESQLDGAQYDIVAKLASDLKNSPYLKTTSTGWILDVAAMRAAASAETLSRLSALDYNVLTAYVDAVRRAALSAELSIAEDRNITSEGTIRGESLTKGEFQAILYNLPVEGKLFRTLYKYFTEISEKSGTVSSAFNLFTSAESTLIFTDEKIIHDAIANNENYFLPQFADNKEAFRLGNLGYFNFTNAEALAKIAQTGGTSFGLFSLIDDWASFTYFGEQLLFANEVWEAFANDPSDKAIMDSWVASINVSANDMFEKMRKDYILTLPLYHVALKEYVSSAGLEVTNELLGGITESLFGLEASTSKMLGAQIETFMRSSGLLAPSAVFRSKPVFYPPDAQILRDDFTTDETNQEVSSFLVAPLIANLFNLIDRGEMSERANLNKPGSPFVHIASKEEETAKAATYRTVLARIALQVLNNAAILRFLGLEDLYYSETNLFKKGREAYPDLNLPSHPYYRSAYNTYPDFYMWNMYEDGDMYNTEVKKEISKAVHISVQRAFDSIKKLGDGVDARKITGREEEGKLTDSASLADLVYNAEGDVSSRTPFYSPVVGEQPDVSVPLSNANLALVRAYTPYQKTPSAVLGDEVISNKIPLPPLSVTEGPGAKSISPLYPSRVGLDKYDELQVEYDKIDTMFGSRAGYLNNKEGYTKKERLDGLALPHDADPNHNFDVESLKLLADQSCMDLFGHKRRLARAIPTFKLYIVEEDQQENRLLNFDDFYSYNGVKEFTIVRSKKSAADHVSITLQNVSGSLDGSKRNAIADADYFSNPKLPIGDDPTTIGTDKEQSFASVVLRTGLNVQLRVGYCVDEATEILTKRGWLKHSEVEVGDIALSLNHKTGLSEWQTIDKVNKFDVENADMILLDGEKHSSLTTFNHKWPVLQVRRDRVLSTDGNWTSKFSHYERTWALSQDLNTNHIILGAAPNADLPTVKKWSDELVELVAWFWTEGHINNIGKNRNPSVTISQSLTANPEYVKMISLCLTKLFGESVDLGNGGRKSNKIPMWRYNKRAGRDEVEFRLNSIASENLLRIAPNREVSLDWIRELTSEQLNLFIDISNKGDGYFSKKTRPLLISQKNPKQLEALELAAILSGHRTRFYTQKTICEDRQGELYNPTCVYVSDQEKVRIGYLKPKKVKYTGITWCPTLKNSSWMARRNGHVYFTGNSNDPDLLEVMISGRIVDLQWNDTGDLCQLLVQSFGTELTQLVKNSEETFYSTHQLLGYLMLQPELMHFGRWEFGKLYQIVEAQDSRLDFFDYEGNSRGHPFGWIDSAYDTVRRHPFVFVGLLGLLSLSDFAPVGGGAKSAVGKGVSKVPTFVRRVSKNVLTVGGRFKWIDDFFKAVRGSEELTTEIGREAINLKIQNRIADVDFGPNISIEGSEIKVLVNGVWESANGVSTEDVVVKLRELLKAELLEMRLAAGRAILASKRIANNAEANATLNKRVGEIITQIDEANTLDEGLDLLTSFESEVAHLNWRQMWFSDPWAYAAPNGTYWSGVGAKPIKNIIRNTVLATAIGAGTITATSVAADAFSLLWSGPGQGPIDAVLRYFTVSKISLMLSPQDDNLFPPAPSDYMRPGGEWLDRQLMKLSPMNWGLIDRQSPVGRYLFDSGPFIKKVDPTACEYQLRNTYIWDVFHEMSLRHPGWIYGARPYGTEFRYTMFFGVPSQRYWARGVSNQFVDRSNRIYKALKDGVNKYEYISLYGNKVGEGLTIEQMESTLGRINEAALAAASWSTMGSEGIKVDTLAIEQVYTTTLLREYLTGLRHRFEPFRRYHLFSSETDIVKNGLISSEVAPYNSVDVQYSELKSTNPTEEGAAGSLLVKAHSFIPDYMLKTKVDKYYPNCRGWVMAARYGMGELTHTMKDIYRGEILLLGNPRIRPWDVGVLLDHYNDMVGPLEIEQVVDTFSYETGYLTEIKPSAFVVTNEISSWPVLEGIKTAVLAIKSIEYDRFGMGPKSLNSFVTAPLEWGVGGKFDEDRLTEKVKKAFGSDSDLINPTSKVFGNVGELPETGDNYFGELAMISGGLFGVSLLSVRATAGTSLPLAVGTGLAAAGAGAAAGVAYVTSGDALRDLVGGYAIFLECMKGDSIQVVPLTKNGRPIVSGLTVQDPAVLWKNLRGSIVRVVDDHVGGTRDLLDLWNNYSTYLWRLPDWSGLGSADLDANGINTTANLIGG